MSTTDAETLSRSYLEWMRSGVTSEILDAGMAELTVPFMDSHNDHLQVYAERLSGDRYLLSDDGYISSQLRTSGVELRGRRREELIEDLLSGYGVDLVGRELQVSATSATLGQAVHILVQAMLALDDMFVLAQPKVESMFMDDVSRFLDDHDVRYTPLVKFAGKSGLDHLVDFVIPRSRVAPERVLHILNSPRRDRIASVLFATTDTRAVRKGDVNFIALVNDEKRAVPGDVVTALENYDVRVASWSEREAIATELAA